MPRMTNPLCEINADGSMSLLLDASVYSSLACLKAAHQLSSQCSMKVSLQNKTVALRIDPLKPQSDLKRLGADVLQVITDYALRERLDVETAPLRNAILAATFSRANLAPRENVGN